MYLLMPTKKKYILVNQFCNTVMKKEGKKISSLQNNLLNVVNYILSKKKDIEKITTQHKTPFYVFDQSSLDKSIDSFLVPFNKKIDSFKAYYALKINHHPLIVKRVVEKGMGLDVASPREIDIAVNSGCKDIVYFSPGKTEDDLKYALKHSDIVTIHIDSFNELKTLGILTNKQKNKIRAGIRIHTKSHGAWKKYGIDLQNLNDFWTEAQKYPFIDLCGIHFHSSRNKDASFYENTIEEVSSYLYNKFNKNNLKKIKYIDFGGGFEVYKSEGYYLDNKKDKFYITESIKIEEYAKKISKAIDKYLSPIVKISYYSEPGRIICNNSMFIALSVVDVKDKSNIILDGGVNMVGWQRFESEYFPLVNISNPSKKELKCNVWGNLCTTWDIWGYNCYAKKNENRDIIIVPNQGALTYSLAQNFIYPIPPVFKL